MTELQDLESAHDSDSSSSSSKKKKKPTNTSSTSSSSEPLAQLEAPRSTAGGGARRERGDEQVALGKWCHSYWISGFKRDDDDDPPRALNGLRLVVRDSPVFLLLVFVPVAVVLGLTRVNDVALFVFSLLGLIPLAKLIGTATEDISLRFGSVVGSLLNATFGNATELIVAIAALFNDEIELVKTSLLGSVLSNMLLVLGMSFFFGGIRNTEQLFHATGAQNSGHLLFIAAFSLILPYTFEQQNGMAVGSCPRANDSGDLGVSHATAVILLGLYAAYLVFQLKTHKKYFEDIDDDDDDDDEEKPMMPMWVAIVVLIVATGLVAWVSEYLVDSIGDFVNSTGVSTVFIGVILFPIAGNAAEHVSALTCAWKNKIGISVGIAVGSSVQISTLVLPLMVVIGWIAGKPMDMLFASFECVSLVLAAILANATMQDGKSNWLEGLLLMCVYIIMAVGFFSTSSCDDGVKR